MSKAKAEAQIPPNAVFVSACCGMSGGPEDKAGLLAEIIPARKLSVVTDFEIAQIGAMAGGPGTIVIAGTGAIAFGRNRSGESARVGGWGHIFGDEGGAFDITRQALRAVLRLEEGWGPTTALREALLDATSASSANELLHWFYTDEWPRSRVAALSALVDSVASDGDSIARGIMESSAQVLAGLAGAVRRQLFSKGEPFRVAYVGGVFRSAWILERFRLLVELNERCTCSAPMLGPAEGALIEAFRAAGETVIPSGASKLQ